MISMKILAYLVAFVAVTVQAERLYDLADDLPKVTVGEASIFEPQFLVLNDYLVKTTKSAEPEENFALAKERAAERPTWLDFWDFEKDSAELFTSLPKSLDGCGYKSYKVLAKNYVATKGRSHQPTGLRRVDAILYHYALEHARKCRPLYADSFKKFQSAVDPQVYRHVTEMFKEVPEADLVKFAKKDYMAEVDMITTGLEAININSRNIIRIFEALERLIEDPEDKKLLYAQPDEKNGGYVSSPLFLHKIYEPYIHEPCYRYLSKSKSVFSPARFDAAIEDDAQKDLLHPADETFRQAWVNHRLCQYMIRMTPWNRIEGVLSSRVPPKST